MRKALGVPALVISVLLAPSAFAQDVSPQELRERRASIGSQIGPNAILIALGAPGDHGEYDQDDDFLWLTDFADPEAALVLMPGESARSEAIFVRDRAPLREVWTGRIPSAEQVTGTTGVEWVLSYPRLRAFLAAALTGRGSGFGDPTLYGTYQGPPTPSVSDAFRRGELEVWLLLDQRGTPETLTPELQLARELREQFPEIRIRDASPLIHRAREVKSASEMARLRRAIDITVEAQKAAMRRVVSAAHEYEVEAEIERTFRTHGAQRPAFPSIVASGANATTLHYESNQDPVVRSGLLLTDIGAEYYGYHADVTRTYPADGSFSPEQRAVYEAVLRTQKKAIEMMRAGNRWQDLHRATEKWLGEELLTLGLITRNERDQVILYFMHGLGHPVGLATHDVYDRTRTFEPGMVLSAEPGIYVRPDDVIASSVFRALPADEQDRIRKALATYGGIGVRIEDNVLITQGDPVVLSAAAPREVAEIESWMKR